MFLVNEILDFGPGRREEARARLAWIHSLMANKPGFQRAIVAKYLGDATRHTILRVWDDEAAFREFRAGPDGNYGRGRPEGLYATVPVVPQWNSFDEAKGGAGGGSYLVKVQSTVPAAAHGAYIAYQKQVNQAAAADKGIVSTYQFQAKEGDDFLTILRFDGEADFARLFEDPRRIEGRASLPEGVSAPDIQCFEIVSEVLPV